ncbi:MAG: minichromosome maintenance protein MCM [Candidatus Lokiarchaeota archaeon]|nr:minichromosome maintenance protein MCM [Candidatus Lokiarchaeota archaeon]
MKSGLLLPLNELKVSYHNKLLTCQGIIAKLSSEFEDDHFGLIQIAFIQCLKTDKKSIGVQRGIDVILQKDHIGLANLGDRVQITGILEVYKAHDSQPRNLAVLAQKIELKNNVEYENITNEDIEKFKNIAKSPNLQQRLANFIFDNILIDDSIKLVGLLTAFSKDSPKNMERNIHGKISMLIIGTSRTFKSTYLRKLEEKLSFMTIKFSQKSDVRFVSSKSRYKIGGERCQISGLTDYVKEGIVLIDNLEELKDSRLSSLNAEFTDILKKASIIAAVHSKDKQYNNKLSASDNLRFPRKRGLLRQFDLVLVANSKLTKNSFVFESEENLYRGEKGNFQFTNEFLRKYIIYAKEEFEPMISNESLMNRIIEFKEEVVNLNKEKFLFGILEIGNLVRGIITLSKAHARIAFRDEIKEEDVEKVLKIYRSSLANVGLI